MADHVPPRDASAEAAAKLSPGQSGRVLEPSPPAITDDWFADDPTSRGTEADGRVVVSPTPDGDRTWHQIVGDSPEMAAWAERRWLGPWKCLAPLPEQFAAVRTDMNRLTFHVLSAAREAATGKIAVRWTLDGWGTPFFGNDVQLRVEGTDLVRQDANGITREPLSSLTAAAQLAGIALDPSRSDGVDTPDIDDPNRPLATSAAANGALSDWFGFGFSVLEELRRDAVAEEEPSRVQLWAEHFDSAMEIGDANAGRRASFGASPGDPGHPEPYLYVGPWGDIDRSQSFWNDEHFPGASLPYAELLDADDQRAAALSFYREGLKLLRNM